MAAAAIVGTAMLGVAAPADATTLTLFGLQSSAGGGTFDYDPTVDRGSITCPSGCEGLQSSQGAGNFPNGTNVPDPTTQIGFGGSADLFDLASSGDADELAFVNFVVDPDFVSGVKTDTGGAATKSFISDAEYILLKIGKDPNYALIHNLDGEQRFDFLGDGKGAGLSHIVTFGGTTTVIPLPASLLLLLSGLGGLGFLGWRRQSLAA